MGAAMNLTPISNPFEIINMLCASMSALASMLVLVTALVFPKMLRSHFFRLIFYISICEFCSSFVNIFGYPKKSNNFCAAQAFIAFFFFRASWFFTVALSHQLCNLALFGILTLKEYHIHAIAWSLTIILALLPLSDHITYGINDENAGHYWCGLRSNDPSNYELWIAICVSIPLIISISLISIMIIRILIHFRWRNILMNNKVRTMVRTLILYPIGMMVIWIPVCIFETINGAIYPNQYMYMEQLTGLVNSVGSLYGFVLSILFFTSSREARSRWRHLVCRNSLYNMSYLAVDVVVIDDELLDVELFLSESLIQTNTSSSSRTSSSSLSSMDDMGMREELIPINGCVDN